MFTLAPLPYEKTALLPIMNEETLDYHYGKHNKAYVDNLNILVPGTEFEGKTLEEIVKTAPAGAIFNNAAQIWNHAFFWECLRSPRENNLPEGELAQAIDQNFGSFEAFKEQFTAAAVAHFGSGWTWLVINQEGKMEIINLTNAGNPLPLGVKPLLGVDIWEHSYYIQYRNARATYIKDLFGIFNWDFVAQQFDK